MSVAGSWTLFFNWGCAGTTYGTRPMTISANGTWTNGEGYSGVWVQEAGMLTFKFDNSNTTYSGNVANSSITGIQSTFAGLNGCFYMLAAGAPTAIDAKAAKHKADSSGK